MRSEKRKNEDALGIPQRSYCKELGIFDIRPKIITSSSESGAFEPSMRHIELQKTIIYITYESYDSGVALLKFHRDEEPYEEYDRIEHDALFYHETEAQDRRTISEQTKNPFTIFGMNNIDAH